MLHRVSEVTGALHNRGCFRAPLWVFVAEAAAAHKVVEMLLGFQ